MTKHTLFLLSKQYSPKPSLFILLSISARSLQSGDLVRSIFDKGFEVPVKGGASFSEPSPEPPRDGAPLRDDNCAVDFGPAKDKSCIVSELSTSQPVSRYLITLLQSTKHHRNVF